jgi:NAD+ synthase
MLKIAVCQEKFAVGDLANNVAKIKQLYVANLSSDLLITPELALCGYYPKDDLFSGDFISQINNSLQILANLTLNNKTQLLVGSPYFENTEGKLKIYNCAILLGEGKIKQIIVKQKRPNYGVFNELRYFATKPTDNIITINNIKVGVFVCEDMWHKDIVDKIALQNPQVCISINASPFEDYGTDMGGSTKHSTRLKVAKYCVEKTKSSLIYLNNVGGQDEVVFDGASFILNTNEEEKCFNSFVSQTVIVDFNSNLKTLKSQIKLEKYLYNREKFFYNALVLSLKDFITKNGFSGVLLGLSGGIDSALTAILVADALGSENLKMLYLPSKYSAKLSDEIVEQISENLKVKTKTISIDKLVDSYSEVLVSELELNKNNVLENIQARVRGQIIMAFANANPKFAVLTTGNKTEVAVGYSTLYGDTVGAFNLLKDLYKKDVYALAKWRNENVPHETLFNKVRVLPESVITRKPSAELRDNQFDEDSLMDYDTLDKILFALIEQNKYFAEVSALYGIDKTNKAVGLLQKAHYKRLQSVLGTKLTSKSLNASEFQFPLTNRFDRLE